MKPLLVFAHWEEAKTLIQHCGAKKIHSPHFYRHYSSEREDLLITGMGIFSIMASTVHYLTNHKENHLILNIGLAGSYRRPLYSWNAISSVHFSHLKTYYTDAVLPSLVYAPLQTVVKPASEEEMKRMPDFLFDMEGYGFLESARRFVEKHRIHLIKFVSDRNGRMDSIKNALETYNKTILETLESILSYIKCSDSLFANYSIIEDVSKKIAEYGQNQRLSHSQIQLLTEKCIYSINCGNKMLVDQMFDKDFLSFKNRDERFTEILKHLNRDE